MSRKFKTIEFFGIPGSGKTYIASIVKKNLIKKGYTVLNARECVTKGTKDYIKTNFFEKISLNYFKLINFKNTKNKNTTHLKKKSYFFRNNNKVKANFLKNTYLQICKKILLKDKKFINILKKIEKYIAISSKKEQQYLFWFYELLASHVIFKNVFKSKKYIFLVDEGLIQRSFIINNKVPKKQRDKFLNSYFKILPISKLIFYISSIKNSIIKVNKLRKNFQIEKYRKISEIKNDLNFLNKYLLAKKKFKFENIKNDKNIEKKIKKIFL